jgi:phage terminase large subunit-like protein
MSEDNPKDRSFSEEVEIAGHQLIERIKDLVAEGNVRLVRIRTESGQVFLEIPLTAGAIAGGVVVLAAPWLAAIGAIAGLATKVSIEIVRTGDDQGGKPPEEK